MISGITKSFKMSTITFDTVVIYNDSGPLDILYGQNSELLKTLQKNSLWETIAEDLDEDNMLDQISNINELNDYHQFNKMCTCDTKIKLFENQSYSKPNTKKLKY